MRTYVEPDYAQTRLRESIVRMGALPILISRVEGDSVLYTDLKKGRASVARLVDIDINPVPLGYANTRYGAVYVTRTPKREDWRQGLRAESIRTIPHVPVGYGDLHDVIIGNYPTRADCVRTLMDGIVPSMAFSRSFAMTRTNDLLYKGKWTVGKVDQFDVELDQRYDWLHETVLEEAA